MMPSPTRAPPALRLPGLMHGGGTFFLFLTSWATEELRNSYSGPQSLLYLAILKSPPFPPQRRRT